MNLKAKVEAILFLTDKPLKALAIARQVNADVQDVRQTILELIHEYEERNGGLEIADEDGYLIQVKDEYTTLIEDIAPLEVPVALLRTLSAIAIKQPIAQSEIIKIRGAGAYDHIKELVERELITKKEDGRSPLLSTTKKFQEYFRLSRDAKSLRSHLRSEDKKSEAAEAALAAEAILAVEGALAAEAHGPSEVVDAPAVVQEMSKEEAEAALQSLECNFESSPDADLTAAQIIEPEEAQTLETKIGTETETTVAGES